jgi:transposase
MARRQFVLRDDEVAVLQRAEAESRDVRELKRLQAVRLYGTGYATTDIQTMVGCSWRALMEWCQAYRGQGVDGLHNHWPKDNALKLSRVQRADLKARLHSYRPDQVIAPEVRSSQGQFWTVSDLKIVVERWYAVTYQGESSYRRLLHECGLSQQQTERQYRSRADEQTVADFEAWLEKK